MRLRTIRLSLFAFLLASCLWGTPAWSESPVSLKSSFEIDSQTVRLSDVFDGVPDQIDRDIAMAPAPGKDVTYNVVILARLAEKYRLGWRPQSMADHIVLTRASTWITDDMIRSAIAAEIPRAHERETVTIVFDRKKLEMALPADSDPIFSLDKFKYDAKLKRFYTEVVAKANGSPVLLKATGRVTFDREVPVLAHRLKAGEVIGERDIEWQIISESRVRPSVLTEKEQLVGKAVRRDAMGGEPLNQNEVMEPRLVSRGDFVTLKIETPFLMISTRGIAMEDGIKGEVIRVQNVHSKRKVEGVVEESGVIRIGVTNPMQTAQIAAQ